MCRLGSWAMSGRLRVQTAPGRCFPVTPPGSDLVIPRRLTIPVAELRERFSRSSGPGGQGVNTTDSRVELSFDVAGSPTIPPDLRDRLLEPLAGRPVAGGGATA